MKPGDSTFSILHGHVRLQMIEVSEAKLLLGSLFVFKSAY